MKYKEQEILENLKNIQEKHKEISILVSTNITGAELQLSHGKTKNTGSLYEIGSSSKMFTTFSLLLLQERGELDINNPISKYLPEGINKLLFINDFDYSSVTVKSVMSHTSGLGEHLNSGDDDKVFKELGIKKEFTFEEILEISRVNTLQPYITPNEKFQYSNVGYILLGKIIEAITKDSYREFIKKNILEPLKLENTFFISDNIQDSRLLSGHYKGNPAYMPSSVASSAGEMISCVGDMEKYILALHNHEIIKKETLDLVLDSIENSIDDVLHYGLGMYQQDGFVGHAGQTFGFLSRVFYRVEDQKYVIIAANDSSLGEEFKELLGIILK